MNHATIVSPLVGCLLIVSLNGCQSTDPKDTSNQDQAKPEAKNTGSSAQRPESADSRSPSKPGANKALAAAQAQAKRLKQALGEMKKDQAAANAQPSAFANRQPGQTQGQVQWSKTKRQSPAKQAGTKPGPTASGSSNSPAPANPATNAGGASTPVAKNQTPKAQNQKPAAAEKAKPLTRGQLIEQLSKRIADSEPSPLRGSASAAMLASIEPGRDIPTSVMDRLTISQREKIARFQSVVELLRHQLVSGEGEFSRPVVTSALNELFENLPIRIRAAELCRKVEGFGVYEPFNSHKFRAGQARKMIVYIELSDFKAKKRDSGKFEVRLRQELALYTQSDGQKVWQHKPVEIVDVSRNRRRDFFVVQMVTLPAELGVGKYVLKVDVVDKNGGSVDAKPIPIQLVAEESLARDRKVDQTKLLRRMLSNDEDQTPLGSDSP